MEYPIDCYKATATAAFRGLLGTFACWTNGWQVGNVFDTLTDYAVRYRAAGRRAPVRQQQ